MYWFGYTLNIVTLTRMALVVGILVDDAIVEIENIARHLRMGKSPYQAAMEAADEIGMAVIATTFALVAVFLPTAFMAGMPGKFFKQFGWIAVLAMLASLVVARLLTPMMSAYMLKAPRNWPRAGWLDHAQLPRSHALVFETSVDHGDRICGFFYRFNSASRFAADRFCARLLIADKLRSISNCHRAAR